MEVEAAPAAAAPRAGADCGGDAPTGPAAGSGKAPAPAAAAAAAAASLLAGRPGFPRGLRVLLVDGAAAPRAEAQAQLEALGYVVTPCACLDEAAALVAARGRAEAAPSQQDQQQQDQQQQQQPPPGTPNSSQDSCGDSAAAAASSADAPGAAAAAAAAQPFDVALADVGGGGLCRGPAAALAGALAAADVPLVLMGAGCGAAWVRDGVVSLGAADVLERPLSSLKLRNLWQHTVRRAMARQAGCLGCARRRAVVAVRGRAAAGASPGAPASPPPSPAAPAPAPAPTPAAGAAPPAPPRAGAAAAAEGGRGLCSPAGCALAGCFEEEDLTADLTALFMGPLEAGDDLDAAADLVAGCMVADPPAGDAAAAAVAALLLPGSPLPPRPRPRARAGGAGAAPALRVGHESAAAPGGASPLSASLGPAGVSASDLSCGTAVAVPAAAVPPPPWGLPPLPPPPPSAAAGGGGAAAPHMGMPMLCGPQPPPGSVSVGMCQPWMFPWGPMAMAAPPPGAAAGMVWGMPMPSVATAPGIVVSRPPAQAGARGGGGAAAP
ncbi:hypothetical protein Rsub_10723 [Raphidocelis subcapitata]|uniref:Response regulatory domain-containing protein n=1 Tax=Raphidocelis subcapitata TaxID=307507 RepID=A0A2V0PJU8_9CHLO|nr:hypothetical protein Rsub_10723 [Raphidocelis subcapitata]|eukprot:GBF97587.1 hypothetical protein Rsub_10723 [Raphidocelis subcapitata]